MSLVAKGNAFSLHFAPYLILSSTEYVEYCLLNVFLCHGHEHEADCDPDTSLSIHIALSTILAFLQFYISTSHYSGHFLNAYVRMCSFASFIASNAAAI